MEPTTFTAYFGTIVSTINESMTEKTTMSTILSAILDTTTTSGPTCPAGWVICPPEKTKYCGTGICCLSGDTPSCVCTPGYFGSSCHRKNASYSSQSTGNEEAEVTALFSALVGVIVIALFVAVVILQIKYYKIRKQRSQRDEEIRKSMRVKPEIRRKADDDDASTRLLRTQPGYSWRQSVKRSTYVSQKSKGLSMSISVPENLLKIGLTTKGREKEANQTQSVDGGGGGVDHERVRIDTTINEESNGSTFQLLQDEDLSMKSVRIQEQI